MRTLLQALWRCADVRGLVTFWCLPAKVSCHVPVDRIAHLGEEDVAELREGWEGSNVYYGLGLRRDGLGAESPGKNRDIIALPAIALDIDFLDGRAHKSAALPVDLEQAQGALEHLPEPSAVVQTGAGVHVYWFFREVLRFEDEARRRRAKSMLAAFQDRVRNRAKEAGWHLDNTESLKSVWRVPGFTNQKVGEEVRLLECDPERRYTLADLQLGWTTTKAPTRQQVSPSASVSATGNAVLDALRRISPKNEFYSALQAVIRGQAMGAQRGDRDRVLQGVCATIAWLPAARGADPKDLAELLRPSLQAWADEEGATLTVEEEIAKAIDKLQRNQDDYEDKQALRREGLGGLARALWSGVAEVTGDAGTNEDDEKDDREDGGVEDFCIQRAIVLYRNAHYVWDFRSRSYSRAKTDRELLPFVRDAWADAPDELTVYYVTNKGENKVKSTGTLVREYGTVVDDVIGDMTIDTSRLSLKESTFFEAMARKRVKVARFDEDIDRWLRLLAGEQYEKVCDWIAAVPRLEDQNCALYLDGKSGAGKGMLAHGLARLWRKSGPTEFVRVVGDYNDDITHCPLIWIDEGIPGRKGNITTDLRAIIGRSSFTCSEKYLPNRQVVGAVRLMISANNANVLMFGDSEITVSDLEAVVGRILYVTAHTEAAEWLEAHNRDGALTRAWVEGDLLAQHCLYLAKTRQLVRGKRFLVEGTETTMHRKLAMQGETNGLVYEWLVRFATSPAAVEKAYQGKQQQPLAMVGNGEIYVNTQCVIDCWRMYLPEDARRPPTSRIGQVLSRLAYRTARVGRQRSRYHVVKADMVLEWCREQQVGNEDRIEENLQRTLDE